MAFSPYLVNTPHLIKYGQYTFTAHLGLAFRIMTTKSLCRPCGTGLDRSKQGGEKKYAGRDLKIICNHYEQLCANKFGKLDERDNLVDVK